MANKTGIEWTDVTWNPVVGCTKVSQGCKNCYAKTLHDRRHKAHLAGKSVPAQYAEPFERVQMLPERLEQPFHWRRPRKVFVNSVSDLFHEQVSGAFLDQVFAVMALTPRHTYQVLTKRAQRMYEYITWPGRYEAVAERGREIEREHCRQLRGLTFPPFWPLPNLWVGTSAENQRALDDRYDHLLRTPAAVRFLSCEPLLKRIDLQLGYINNPDESYGLDWVIAGGESGRGFRPLNLDDARSLRDQCVDARVPFFFKQVGGNTPKAGGRLLDGREWDQMPGVAHAQ